MFCNTCGKEIADKAVFCVHCGCNTNNAPTKTITPKSRVTYILLGFFFGCIGVHNFYAGYIGRGLAQLVCMILFIGIFFVPIWVLVEIIAVNKDANGNSMT